MSRIERAIKAIPNPTDHDEAEGLWAQTQEWIGRFARLGYIAKGAIYILVGVLAARAALGLYHAPEGSEEALMTLAGQRFGHYSLALIAVGLSGYVVWRFYQAITDCEGKGNDIKGIAQRLGYATSGLVYAGLALTSVQIILRATDTDGDAPSDWTAQILELPMGQWLVVAAGIVIIGVGGEHLLRGITATFLKDLDREKLSPFFYQLVVGLGRFGIAARGAIYVLIGVFLVQAGLRYDAERAAGLGEALQTIAGYSRVPWLIGFAAIGLIAFGLFSVLEARYRSIEPEGEE